MLLRQAPEHLRPALAWTAAAGDLDTLRRLAACPEELAEYAIANSYYGKVTEKHIRELAQWLVQP
jgi:hypothetical protein